MLRRAGVTVLGAAADRVVVEQRPGGRPAVRVGESSGADPDEPSGADPDEPSGADPGLGADPAAGPVELPVSVSRTDGFVVVAARPRGPVGIDVERLRPVPARALARRWYAPAEAAWLAGRPECDRAADFLRLWTAKEAVGKALGLGLRDGGLRRVMPALDRDGAPLRPVPGLPTVRVGHLRVAEALVLAVAVVGAADRVDVVVEAVPSAGHDVAAVRNASTDRTSLPVVVRGS
ncbi:4'-phosphopantetheinyl transferase superfamily protein [Solwaraspora sp. WMMD406]|uniref:4'-phosphopantetheinyl transferase family protein n=1 Tax=Solwaraspora sp. WMMD406 TaxID=3016095 RepID=UPI00241686FC|nr:4'-phosphopantetheinyl transferase superfamily protein [Solwaraspora sp. WMMD406]MDG4764613.1 4'-phosphopantetheinyl transferase superfamily protein [Solwaraspora sp. WMMD406]